jgi:hypothetical protein
MHPRYGLALYAACPVRQSQRQIKKMLIIPTSACLASPIPPTHRQIFTAHQGCHNKFLKCLALALPTANFNIFQSTTN